MAFCHPKGANDPLQRGGLLSKSGGGAGGSQISPIS